MLKVVDVCTRVEGHGNVKIMLQNDQISSVDFELDAFRGFEHILIGKRLIELPRIVSRICGVCHASQAIVSCKAIESAFNVEPTKQTVIIRRILMTGELLKSHIMHYFFQFLPDLLLIFDYSNKIFTPFELMQFDPQLTTYIFELIKFGNEIDRLFGGRSVHLITTLPGGIIYSPARKNLATAKRYFQKALTNIEYIIDRFINLFTVKRPPSQFDLPDPIYFGLHFHGTFDRYDGLLRIIQDPSKPLDFQKDNYIRYFDRDPEMRGITFSLNKERNILVGPIARYNLIESYGMGEIDKYLDFFDKNWKKSILYANILRLVEIYLEIQKTLTLLDDPLLNSKQPLAILKDIQNKDGIGVVEAPRGTLIHHYRIDKNKIVKEVKLLIATELNIPIINEMITKYAKELYNKNGDINIVKKEVQTIIRAFDPCISCATH